MTAAADVVLAELRTGPATIAELAGWTSLPRRDVEAAIQELRLAGVPICSDATGVRIARDADELARSNAALRRRAMTQLLTLRAQRRAERRLRDAETRPLVLFPEAVA